MSEIVKSDGPSDGEASFIPDAEFFEFTSHFGVSDAEAQGRVAAGLDAALRTFEANRKQHRKIEASLAQQALLSAAG